MSTSSRAPLYDIFKLIVAIILLLIFFLLIWMQSTQIPQTESPSATPVAPHPTSTLAHVISSPTGTQTSLPPTVTTAVTNIPPPTGTSTPGLTSTSTQPPASIPSPTETSVAESTVTPVVENASDINVCEAVSRSRLQVGGKATILSRLNFRSSAGIRNNWILTNISGTQVEVIGGPACTTYQNGSSYLWWQIKLSDGRIGWSAEASAFGAFYFMEPVP